MLELSGHCPSSGTIFVMLLGYQRCDFWDISAASLDKKKPLIAVMMIVVKAMASMPASTRLAISSTRVNPFWFFNGSIEFLTACLSTLNAVVGHGASSLKSAYNV